MADRDGRGISRRSALGVLAAAGVAAALPPARPATGAQRTPVPAFELEEATIEELGRAMGEGRLSSEELCRRYLGRIDALDGRLRSILGVNPQALDIARALDRERRAKGPRGPLHGTPIVLKDNVATADAMETTAGSLALVGARPRRDAAIVRALRRAGAVLLAKTNLSEWANFRSSRASSGWSGRGGQCRNPYVLDRTPCGSSSGTAAAVAANLAAAGVGTETDGSVVCPSAACSLVGIKPTVGLLGRSGIIPISKTQDTAGPMTRTVADAAALLAGMIGPDPDDPAWTRPPYDPAALLKALEPASLEGMRIGVPREKLFGYSPQADAAAEEVLHVLRRLGATVVDPADIPHLGQYDDAEMEVLLFEFKAGIIAYLEGLGPGAPVHDLAGLIRFNERHRDREMPYFGQDIFEKAEAKGPLTDPKYRAALKTCRELSRKEGLDAAFAKHRVDVFLAPTGSPPWTIDLINGDHFLGASSTPAAVSGYASLTLPAGYVFDLPVGVALIGKAWSEPLLIRIAAAVEREMKVRRPPRLLPTLPLDD
ncbi:MAG: amidase [Acidobacteria bacterium]|nr:amidase [Acidobacteriota bacterium]